MLFGVRDPESDLNVEMLEELHMFTGCELLPSQEDQVEKGYLLAHLQVHTNRYYCKYMILPKEQNGHLTTSQLVERRLS